MTWGRKRGSCYLYRGQDDSRGGTSRQVRTVPLEPVPTWVPLDCYVIVVSKNKTKIEGVTKTTTADGKKRKKMTKNTDNKAERGQKTKREKHTPGLGKVRFLLQQRNRQSRKDSGNDVNAPPPPPSPRGSVDSEVVGFMTS